VNNMLRDFKPTDPHCALRVLVESVGFGHEVKVDRVDTGHAWYCAKYVSKGCDDRYDLPWLDRETNEVVKGNSRYVEPASGVIKRGASTSKQSTPL